MIGSGQIQPPIGLLLLSRKIKDTPLTLRLSLMSSLFGVPFVCPIPLSFSTSSASVGKSATVSGQLSEKACELREGKDKGIHATSSAVNRDPLSTMFSARTHSFGRRISDHFRPRPRHTQGSNGWRESSYWREEGRAAGPSVNAFLAGSPMIRNQSGQKLS